MKSRKVPLTPYFYNRPPSGPGIYAFLTGHGTRSPRGYTLYRVTRGVGRGGPLVGRHLDKHFKVCSHPKPVARMPGKWSAKVAGL